MSDEVRQGASSCREEGAGEAAEDVSGDGGVLKTVLRCGDGERPTQHSRITTTCESDNLY